MNEPGKIKLVHINEMPVDITKLWILYLSQRKYLSDREKMLFIDSIDRLINPKMMVAENDQ